MRADADEKDEVQPEVEEMSIEDRKALRLAKEEKFQKDMTVVGKQIIEVGDDGNCLFRSIAL